MTRIFAAAAVFTMMLLSACAAPQGTPQYEAVKADCYQTARLTTHIKPCLPSSGPWAFDGLACSMENDLAPDVAAEQCLQKAGYEGLNGK